MPAAHRKDDHRVCGAQTIVQGQSTVTVNSKLWAVENDPETHGDGQLHPSFRGVYIHGKPVIVNTPDPADPDDAPHINTQTAEGSPNVYAYS